MKNKIYLFTSLIAILYFVACNDVYDHVAEPPQSYEQEEAQTINGFTFKLGADFNSPIVLTEEKLTPENTLRVIETTATPELSEGATLKFTVEASNTNEFKNVIKLPSTSLENSAVITVSDLNEAVKELYGKAPNAREIYLRASYYIVDGTSSSLMPETVVFGPATITPVAPIIETEYYLIRNINGGWDLENLSNYKFEHSGKDVYEDPIFTILVNNVKGNFKIVPKSSKDAASLEGVLGSAEDGATDLEGNIVKENAGAIQITEPGWVKITLNMMEYRYNIEIIGEMALEIYVPGGHQEEWDPKSAPTLYNRNFDFKYNGFIYFPKNDTEFKFTSEPNWDGTNYGDGGDGVLSTDGGAKNLKVNQAGMYKIDVNLSGNPTYSLVKTEWGLIGDATEGSWDNSTPMTYNPETGLWSITTTLSTGAFKFRANDGWDINLGGDTNNLSFGGDNIPITEEGTYTISLDLSDSKKFNCSIVKQ